MLVFDFFYYWHHRLQHEIPALWEQHKLHHMDETLSCLTNLRHHWLEEGIRVFTITIPMTFLIGLTPVQGVLISSAIAQWAVFIHANLRIPLGPLTPVFAGPQLAPYPPQPRTETHRIRTMLHSFRSGTFSSAHTIDRIGARVARDGIAFG